MALPKQSGCSSSADFCSVSVLGLPIRYCVSPFPDLGSCCGCFFVFLLDRELNGVFGHYLCFCFGSLKVVGREQKVCCLKTNMKHNALFIPLVVRCVHLFFLWGFLVEYRHICISFRSCFIYCNDFK